ncbi:Uncharacterized protein dnm_052760 [Desulfonema magnum]|uniref:Uncharacterized protein n=1 Tax=Desulfonema magnum TaxID=45655 RepID=A0A975BPG4_9BACT|nr:Uncharacterized protein dnm_052760 [Desulfonema magnum]
MLNFEIITDLRSTSHLVIYQDNSSFRKFTCQMIIVKQTNPIIPGY